MNRELDPNDYKVTDTQVNANGVSTSGVVFDLLSNLSPGVGGKDAFIGQKINPVGLNLNWSVILGDNTNLMRLILFQWFDASTPVPSGVLQGNCLSTVNLVNRENIKVLRDELVSMALMATGGYNQACGKFYVKSKKMIPAQYNVDLSKFQKGGLYLLVISDSVITPNPTVSFYSRCTFLDN